MTVTLQGIVLAVKAIEHFSMGRAIQSYKVLYGTRYYWLGGVVATHPIDDKPRLHPE